jgi:hypothetical protein
MTGVSPTDAPSDQAAEAQGQDSSIQDGVDVLCRRGLHLGPADFTKLLDIIDSDACTLKGTIELQTDSMGWQKYFCALAGTRLFIAENAADLSLKKYKDVMSISWAW